MSSKVGSKGQIVIEKEIRERLGVEPGWRALQSLVDDHVEIHFIPPEHNRSLAGILAKYVPPDIDPDTDWEQIEEIAWKAAAEDRARRMGLIP